MKLIWTEQLRYAIYVVLDKERKWDRDTQRAIINEVRIQ